MWLDAESIDLAFACIFLILTGFTLFNLFKHSYKKRFAYALLLIFDLVRIVGNAILVAGVEKSKGTNVNLDNVKSLLTAGYILQGIGYGFLIGASLRLYNRAIAYSQKGERQQRQQQQQQQEDGLGRGDLIKGLLQSPSRTLHLINVIATILLIVGLTKSGEAFTPGSNSSLNSIALVGAYLYCAVTAGLLLMTIYHLFIVGAITKASRTILIFIFAALIPMAARTGYTAFRFQESKVTSYNVWVHLVFQDLAEMMVIIIFVLLGFTLARIGGDTDIDERRALSYPKSGSRSSDATTMREGDTKLPVYV